MVWMNSKQNKRIRCMRTEDGAEGDKNRKGAPLNSNLTSSSVEIPVSRFRINSNFINSYVQCTSFSCLCLQNSNLNEPDSLYVGVSMQVSFQPRFPHLSPITTVHTITITHRAITLTMATFPNKTSVLHILSVELQ